MSDLKQVLFKMCKELNITIEDVCKALGFSIQEQETQEQKIKKSYETSLISVLKDESKTTEQKEELLQKSVNEFIVPFMILQKKNKNRRAKEMDINKMNEDDKAACEALKRNMKNRRTKTTNTSPRSEKRHSKKLKRQNKN